MHPEAPRLRLPADHPERAELHDEVHARPPEALRSPVQILSLALLSPPSARADEEEAVRVLATRHGVAPPPVGANHFSADLGPYRLRWERHTEVSTYRLIRACAAEAPFEDDPRSPLPVDWIASLPGKVLAAARVAVVPAPEQPADPDALSARFFGGNVLVGGAIAGGVASAYTDFRIHADGCSRFLIHDRGMTPRRAGRMTQRLLEIDGYRMLALLALPVARELAPGLAASEQELAEITRALRGADPASEPVLLERLTRLQAEVERWQADVQYRFAAAHAYDELVQRRTAELREGGQEGLQTFREFTERRFAPAMATCRSTASRLESLSQRVGRASQLLSTRIEVTRERQNQQLLESMDRRAEVQLHLQSTVEGLSVAAVTYYVVGLVGYLAKGLHEAGLAVDPALATAVSIPFVALVVALGVRRVRRMVTRPHA